jgi:hypothetical protein
MTSEPSDRFSSREKLNGVLPMSAAWPLRVSTRYTSAPEGSDLTTTRPPDEQDMQ